MKKELRRLLASSLTVALIVGVPAAASCAGQAKPPVQAQAKPGDPAVNVNAKIMADFTARVAGYDKLRDQLRATLPRLPQAATPTQVDDHQRQLGVLIAKARTGATQGEMFTPDMATVVRGLMASVFKPSQDKKELRASIAEENPRGTKVTVNGRYPSDVPLTTMPPDVLKNLPPLPKEMEYRFVGDSLILLDARAHIVVDFMLLALPT